MLDEILNFLQGRMDKRKAFSSPPHDLTFGSGFSWIIWILSSIPVVSGLYLLI
jgi:hypothetical protein